MDTEKKEINFSDKETPEFLQTLAGQYGTPLLVIDHISINRVCEAFKKSFPDLGIFFPVKVLPIEEVLHTVYMQGFGYDVASLKELQMALKVIQNLNEEDKQNFIHEKIIFAHPVKSIKAVMEISKYRMMATYDNYEEIIKIKKYGPNTRLILRISAHNPDAHFQLGEKFGCEPEHAIGLIEEAVKQGLAVEGISFHIGSQSIKAEAYVSALNNVLAIFKEAEKRHIKLRKVDIGGGFPIFYENTKAFTLEESSKLINPFIPRFPAGTQFFAEPGRVIVDHSGILLTQIIGKTFRKGKQCLYLDDGVYGCLSVNVCDMKRYPQSFKKQAKGIPTIFFGPTCDCLDQLQECLIPESDVGDIFYTTPIGAYGFSCKTDFNGMGDITVYHHAFDS